MWGFDRGHLDYCIRIQRHILQGILFNSEGDSVVLFRTQHLNSQEKTFIRKFINKHNNIGIIKATNFIESINN